MKGLQQGDAATSPAVSRSCSTHHSTSADIRVLGGLVSLRVLIVSYIGAITYVMLASSEMERLQGLTVALVGIALLTALLVFILPSEKELSRER